MRTKLTFILCILWAPLFCLAQSPNDFIFSYKNFESEILAYKPQPKATVAKEKFDHAVMILNETVKSVKNDPKNFNLADYFNILTAFVTLKESEQNIKTAFEKFKNTPQSCEYFIAFEKNINTNQYYEPIRDAFNEQLKKCKTTTAPAQLDHVANAQQEHFDTNLVKVIKEIALNDQKFRNADQVNAQQASLDLQNQKRIDSLYQHYKTYIGRSLVGEELAATMFLVIQHSNLAMMERYLPVVTKATAQKEVSVSALKLLIDRFYSLKYGYQVFGSQSGFGTAVANENTRNEIKKKYGID